MSEIKDSAKHLQESKLPRRCVGTRSFKTSHNAERNEAQEIVEHTDFQKNYGKRRTSLSTQPRIHPATRLASVADKLSTTLEQLIQTPKSKECSEIELFLTAVGNKKLPSPRDEASLMFEKELLKRALKKSMNTPSKRILRPRYPRTPSPETALLLSPKVSTPRSKTRNLRSSTLKSSSLFSGILTEHTRTVANSRPSTPCTEKSRTPKLKATPKSFGSTQRVPGTPKSKTPKGQKINTPRTPRSRTPSVAAKFLKEEVSYLCEICGETLPEKKELLKHHRLHGRHKHEDMTSTPMRNKLTRTPKSSKKDHGNFECEICQKKFKFRSNLKSHRLIHEQQKIFKCQICRRDLLVIAEGQGRLVVENLTKTGNGNTKDVCKNCCLSSRSLDNTGRGTKAAERRFMCEKCARTFVSETNLKMHLKTHVIDKIRDILKTTSTRFSPE